MERTKLKLAVIVLLALLNLCLLSIVLLRHGQAQLYEQTGHQQALIYLENQGISVQESVIPWDSVLLKPGKDPTSLILSQAPLPVERIAETWDVQPMAQPETLLVAFANGLNSSGLSCQEITAITEGYTYTSQDDRAVLTPIWVLETDSGTFHLDCASRELAQTPAHS